MNDISPLYGDDVPWGIRTLDLLLRRQLLYPAELKAHSSVSRNLLQSQAGDGNRTHITSLEGWNSTTELHSRAYFIERLNIIPQAPSFVKTFFHFFEKKCFMAEG